MIKVEPLKSITLKQKVSRVKKPENKILFKDTLTKEINKVSNNTNGTDKTKEATNVEAEEDKNTQKTTSNTNDKKAKENKQKTNNDENKKAKVENKEKKTKANNTENQQIAFIDTKHIAAKDKVNGKTNNKNHSDKKVEVLLTGIKNKDIKPEKKSTNNKAKLHINIINTKENKKNSKNTALLKDTLSTKDKVETDNNEKSKHARLIDLGKNTENLKEHKNDKGKRKSITTETKLKVAQIATKQKNKKEIKTNHPVATDSIKGNVKKNKNIKSEHTKETKFHIQIEKEPIHTQSFNLSKEKQHKKGGLISKNHATQKDTNKKVKDVRIKHIDTKDLEKANDKKYTEILKDSNNKNIKITSNNATKLETNKNNQMNSNHNLKYRQDIEIKRAKIKKASFIKTKDKNDKKTLKVDTKKQHTVSIEKDIAQNGQEKDIHNKDNHQQNFPFNGKESIELIKKSRNNDTQKSTFINNIKEKTVNYENNKTQQVNNTHIYTTNTQTSNINQNQQIQTNQANLHPPLDKVIKEIDKISNLKPPVTKSIILKLNPPHLGNLRLRVSLDAQKNLTVSIAVHDKNTYKTIVNHIDSLKEYLVTNGIKVQHIDVHNSFNENFMNQFSNGSGNFQQQGQANGNQTNPGFNYNNFNGETVRKESQIMTQSRDISGIDINV